MIRRAISIIAVVALVSCLGAGPHSSTSGVELSGKGKLNVVLIVVDALRPDHLGCYGYERNTSPQIDRLAEEGVLFKNVFTQGVLTRISVASLFTSLYPSVHQVYKLDAPLEGGYVTLPEVLRRNGWTTAVFAGLTLTSFSNFTERFDESYIDTAGAPLHKQPRWKNKYKVTPEITSKALAYLKKARKNKKPFFLYVHYYDVHPPYVLPDAYNRIFWQGKTDEALQDFVINSFRKDRWPHGDVSCERGSVKFQYIISQYDGSIRYVDDHIKMILEQLKRSGLDRNTLVILTSDHGESFLEHGCFFHGETLYDEALRVPLIMRLAGSIEKNKSVNSLVRLIDVMPTILDILGVKENIPIQGESLMRLLGSREALPKVSFSEGYFYGNGGGHLKCIRTDRWKFIETRYFKTNNYVYELYDLSSDQEETKNLVNTMPQEAEVFKTRLMEYTRDGKKTRDVILGQGHIEEPIALDEEKVERFRSLGYIQ